jgi:hypothetical protein
MISTVTRQMTPRERKVLEAMVSGGFPVVTATDTARGVAIWTTGLAVTGVLAYGLVLLSPAPFVGGLLGGVLLLSALICMWAIVELIAAHVRWGRVNRTFRRDQVPQLEAALADGNVRALHVEAAAVVEIEEGEDEGAGFVFDVGDGRLLFLKGQRYWPAEDGTTWPNTCFDVVRTVVGDRWVGIFCDGAPLEPADVVAAADRKDDIVWEEHEEIVEADLQEFARSMRRAAPV